MFPISEKAKLLIIHDDNCIITYFRYIYLFYLFFFFFFIEITLISYWK